VVLSLAELQQRCSRLAGEAFRRDGLRAMVWLTEDANGATQALDTPYSAPAEVDDATALKALVAEMRADFAHDRVTGYAVAFIGRGTFTGIGCAILARPPSVRRLVVVIEAHDGRDSLVATRDIEAGMRLGPLQRHARATGRFGGLLARESEEPA
jgi:hypothetical protein